MATEGTGFIESLMRSIGILFGAAEADSAAEGLVVFAIVAALILIVGSWFFRPDTVDSSDYGVNHFDHGGCFGSDGSDCGGDGGCGD